MSISNTVCGFWILLGATLGSLAHAQASSLNASPSPKYQQECAACHLAYPSGMLPAASWQRIMASLDKHYGTDASLDDATNHDIAVWLKTRAGSYKRVSEAPPQDRITQSKWFLQTHRPGEVPADAWKRAAVGSAANCGACHRNAAQGSFNEREIRIPK